MLPLHPSDPHDVGGMTLVSRLGVGGMGVVYLARQGEGDLVALKVIRPDLTADPQFRSRFTQEVRHALRVRGPFLAEAREASTSLTPQFIAWAYVPGEDLGLTVRRHGPLLAVEVMALAAALADSLGRLHSAAWCIAT
jgi:serine/threonine protein kinase